MTRSLRRLTGPALLLALLAAAAACAGGSGGASDASAVGAGSRADSGAVAAARPAARAGAADAVPTGAAVIATGTVEITSDDVPAARAQVLRIVARAGGEVDDEQASTGAADAVSTDPVPADQVPADSATTGPPLTRTHLVVRVPSARFDAAMADLSGVGRFVSSTRQARDVTTQVIDVHARVRAEARSVARIQTFFDRAGTVKDVIAVETQLSRRQADLDSLRHRSAYLDDQTSLSTITIDLSRTTAAARRTDHAAFAAGLLAGWHGLTGLLGFLLRALGALLPFLLVLVPLGLVGWRWRRALVSRRA